MAMIDGPGGFAPALFGNRLMCATDVEDPVANGVEEIVADSAPAPEDAPEAEDIVVVDQAPSGRATDALAVPVRAGFIARVGRFAGACWERVVGPNAVARLETALNHGDWNAATATLLGPGGGLLDRQDRLYESVMARLGMPGPTVPSSVVSMALYIWGEGEGFPMLRSALRAMMKQEKWDQLMILMQCLSEEQTEKSHLKCGYVQTVFRQHIESDSDASIPTEVLAAGCRLRGKYDDALALLMCLYKRGARLEVVGAAVEGVAFLEVHVVQELMRVVGDRFGGANGITQYRWLEKTSTDGGLLTALMPFIRARAISPAAVGPALKMGCGTRKELLQLGDVLIEQQCWNMLQVILEGPHVKQKRIVARHLLARIPSDPNDYRRIAIPERLVELAKGIPA